MSRYSRSTHRARRALEAVGRSYPGAWKEIDRFRGLKGGDLPDWPEWCFMPIAAGYAIVSGGGENRVPPELAHHPAIVTGLATWRMTQGIYRFDPAVYEAVADTPVEGDLPTDLLYRLPEWCVYVEMDAMLGASRVHGFWAWLEYDVARGGARELRLLLDCAPDPDQPLGSSSMERQAPLSSIPLSLDAPDLETALGVILSSGQRVAESQGFNIPGDPGQMVSAGLGQLGTVLRPAISLLLYLCSQTGEIGDRRQSDRQPGNPAPKRTRRHGWRLFAADGPTEWGVGTRMGAALRATYQREQTGSDPAPEGRHVRPHVRRAHWHTFLSGARKRDDGTKIPSSERRRDLRWMPPVPVNLEDVNDLPATIRKVE